MELYMMNRPHGRMILASVEKGPLVWPSITEDGVTRLKGLCWLIQLKPSQADCDIKAFNIFFQGLPTVIYAFLTQPPIKTSTPSTTVSTTTGTFHHISLLVSYTLINIPILNTSLSTYTTLMSINPPFTQVYSQTTINQTAGICPTHLLQPTTEFSPTGLQLVGSSFKKGDDPIDAINHMMSFLTAVVTSRYPTTNNQLRTSSNPRQQATIYDGKVTVQPVQGRHTSYAAGTTRKYTSGHIAKQCTKPKRKRDETWFNDKVLLVQAQAGGQALTEEEIAFLADPGLPDVQKSQTVSNHKAAYLSENWMIYDSDCDELNSAKIALMANLSRSGSDALTEVHNQDNLNYDLLHQSEQIMMSSEQSNDVSQSETDIISDSNIIPYSQYLSETSTGKNDPQF
ncbi:hypothetical protein Tco_0480334 [Tanacetum coccineum]